MEEPTKNGDITDFQDEKGRFIEGNPGGPGRIKGSISITSAIKKKLEEIPEGQRKTYLDAFVIKMFKKAITDEDMQALKLIWNYVDGMPKESKDITSGGKPIFVPSEILEKYGIDTESENNSEGSPPIQSA